MNNFPVEHNGKTYWISRSVAVVGALFAKNAKGEWCVLANKRGEGCPDFNGYWNIPCGYLDWDESGEEASAREIYEETGLEINPASLVFEGVASEPTQNRQNVSLRFYSVSPFATERLEWLFSTKHMEENEVEGIRFIPMSELDNYKWAFGHGDYVKKVYKYHVKWSGWYGTFLRLYENFC